MSSIRFMMSSVSFGITAIAPMLSLICIDGTKERMKQQGLFYAWIRNAIFN